MAGGGGQSMPTQFPDQLGAGWAVEPGEAVWHRHRIQSCLGILPFLFAWTWALLGSVASMPRRQSSDKRSCSWRFLKPPLFVPQPSP